LFALLCLLVAASWALPARADPPEVREGPATISKKVVVRKKPKARGKKVAKLKAGTEVEVVTLGGPWVRVRFTKKGKEKEGWVPKEAIEQEPPPEPEPEPEPEEEAAKEEPAKEEEKEEEGAVKRIRLAVYTLEANNVDERLAGLVTDSFVAEFRKLQGVSTIGMREIQDMLTHAERKRMLGCEADQCLMEIGGALGVDYIVTGNMGAVGESHVLNLRLIDILGMKVRQRVSKRMEKESGEEFLASVGPSVEEMLPKYDVREGYTRGVPPEVARRINPPPLGPVWFWSTAAASAVVAAAGAGFGLAASAAQEDWHALGRKAEEDVVDAEDFSRIQERLEGRALWANVLFATAGALALTAGIEALFTDWQGDAEFRAGGSDESAAGPGWPSFDPAQAGTGTPGLPLP